MLMTRRQRVQLARLSMCGAGGRGCAHEALIQALRSEIEALVRHRRQNSGCSPLLLTAPNECL